MVQPNGPPRNGFERQMRKVYNPMGFSKGYNFVLWFILGGALFGFSLARLEYLNFNVHFCPSTLIPGDTGFTEQCYWMQWSRYKVGMLVHLGAVLPAGLLVVFQFVPAIRHRYILYHRIAGYLLILLMIVGNAGAITISQEAMEGDLVTRTFVTLVALLVMISFGLAIYNVKRLQLDQHRAWMLRTWIYIGFIVTLRIIQDIMSLVISTWSDQSLHLSIPCDELRFAYKNDTALYNDQPACAPGNERFTTDGYVSVKTNMFGNAGQLIAGISSSFAAAGVLALVLHAIGVEIYLHLTPREAARLRLVSYRMQLERGFRHPGSAGLTSDRLGDSDPWVPQEHLEMKGPETPEETNVEEIHSKGLVPRSSV